jgi:hypothetical protein
MQTLGSNWIIVWCVLFFSLVYKPNQFLDQKKIQGTDSIVVPGATIWIGERIHVVAMDSNWTVPDEDIASLPPEKLKKLEELENGRDHEMAKSVIKAREKSAKAIVIACAGNVHSQVTKGAVWDPKYIPMGWYVSKKVKNLVSLNAKDAGGQAWGITERGTGPTNYSAITPRSTYPGQR